MTEEVALTEYVQAKLTFDVNTPVQELSAASSLGETCRYASIGPENVVIYVSIPHDKEIDDFTAEAEFRGYISRKLEQQLAPPHPLHLTCAQIVEEPTAGQWLRYVL